VRQLWFFGNQNGSSAAILAVLIGNNIELPVAFLAVIAPFPPYRINCDRNGDGHQ
jgi:hypothetical protein